MKNLAICNNTNDCFKKGYVYECTWVYNTMIDIVPEGGSGLIQMNTGDENFTFVINATDEIIGSITKIYQLVQYPSNNK